MEKLPLALIAAILGAIVGASITFIFNKLPEKWLQDYDYDPNSPDFRLSKRMKFMPHGLISVFFCSLIYSIGTWISYDYLFNPLKPIHVLVILLTVPVIMIIIFSDRLNRIIPDQCSLALIFIAIISIFGDYFEDSLWFAFDSPWYYAAINKVIALFIGFGVLWLIGFIAESLLGRESMGQGDMKLLAACGLLVGCYGLIVIVYVTAFTSIFVALPLLIRKRIRIANENKMIRESDDPAKTRRELRKKKAEMHFADNPDYVAFGPFLALGAAVFLIFEPIFFEMLLGLIVVAGWYF